jgi:translin
LIERAPTPQTAAMERAAEIAAIGAECRQTLEDRHRAREIVLAASRLAIQSSAASIRATHRGEYDSAAELARDARARVAEADAALASQPDLRGSGPVHDARKEVAEAWLTLALVRGDALPERAELGVDASAYLNGMAEAASELRRQVLDCLRRGDLERGETLMAAMDDVYSVLATIDYPDMVTGGLRRTTDALRAVLERTRGDLTTTIVASRLQAAIDAARA